MSVLIGIDIGTTAVKAVMLAKDSSRLAAYAQAYPTQRPQAGWAEQDPQDWWHHVMAALAAFADHPQAGEVAAIGLTSQVNSHVFADARFSPLMPAINWQDTRAHAQARALDSRLSPAEKIAALGAPMPIDASHALARMAWMAEARPDLWAATRHVFAPKDWITARLTGVAMADPVSSVGLVGEDGTYAAAITALLPRADAVLPPLADPLTVAGPVQDGLPFAGVPVVVGMMDAWAAMFGVGVAAEGQAMLLSGTSDVLGLISATRHDVAGAISFAPWRGIRMHAAPISAGGAALDWVARLVGRDVAGALDLVGDQKVTVQSPLFLPHLSGERAPLWDAQAKGTFAGLTQAHGAADMVLAVMEGVGFAARLALETLEATGGLRPAALQGGGGGTGSDLWCQMRADICGRPFRRMIARDAGAVGASVMAGVAVGLVPDLVAATRSLVQLEQEFTPDPVSSQLADHRFGIWRALYAQIQPINAALHVAL